jgi:hypothetical protein
MENELHSYNIHPTISMLGLPYYSTPHEMGPYPSNPDKLSKVQSSNKKSFETIIQSPVTEQAWAQSTLEIKQGGLGLRSSQQHAEAAYIAFFSNCIPYINLS